MAVESDDDTPASQPRKITARMAASNNEDTLIIKEAHPQLATKQLNPLLEALTDIRHLSTSSAKQTYMLDIFISAVYPITVLAQSRM